MAEEFRATPGQLLGRGTVSPVHMAGVRVDCQNEPVHVQQRGKGVGQHRAW